VSTKDGHEYERVEYTPYGELWIERRDAGMGQDGATPFRFTGKELDEETGFYYYGARYLNPKTSMWISADPAMGDYIPKAPVDDEAKKHNGNLPGMGGVFNYVNFHVYHYAGNNPVKYVDPDGTDIHNVTIVGVGGKLVVGAGLSVGFAWDDNNNIAILITANAGVGFEASADTPLTPSYSVTKGVNIADLKGIGPIHISADASLNGIEVNVGVGIGRSFDIESNEYTGWDALYVGGGVNFAAAAIYIDLNEASDMIVDMGSDAKQVLFDFASSMQNQMSAEVYKALSESLAR
jgi:RHS repeat-associated protein